MDGVTASVAVNPLPFNTTSLPTIPLEGAKVSEGSITNGCVPVLRAESVAVTF
jgi:hypothetical protein